MKVKLTVEHTIDVDPEKEFPEGYTTEDILEVVREQAMDYIEDGLENDVVHITAEVVTNGS